MYTNLSFEVLIFKLIDRMAPKKAYGHKLHIESALNSLHLMMSFAEGPHRPGIIKGQVSYLVALLTPLRWSYS